MTPKGDHIPKEDRGEGTRWKAPLSTRPEKRNPGWRNSTDPREGRTAVRTNASRSPQRQPEAVESHEVQKQTQPKEGKQRHDRGLRKNTDRTWDRWPNNQTRNTTGPRRPEAQQLYEGQPTSTWQTRQVLGRPVCDRGAIPRTLVQSNVVRSKLIILINEEINEVDWMVSNSAKLDRRTKQHTQFGVSVSNGSRDMARTKSWRKKQKKYNRKK